MIDPSFIFDALPQTNTSTTFLDFVLNLIGAGLTSMCLGLFYTKFGTSLSNREKMASSFSALSMTTMLVISIIKSNLALSLGLVGALSIVRFRAAIKEPEELIFLFLNISIGIGFGADQGLLIIFSVPFICLALYIHNQLRNKNRINTTNSLFITISGTKADFDLPMILDNLDKHSLTAEFKRFSKHNESYESSFVVTFNNLTELNLFQETIVDKRNDISIIENTTIFQ